METRSRGRKSASRTRSRGRQAQAQRGARTRTRGRAAAVAQATTSGSGVLSQPLPPLEVTPSVSEAQSVAASTTTQTPSNIGDENSPRSRRTGKQSVPKSSDVGPPRRAPRRTRRPKDSSLNTGGRQLRPHPRQSEGASQSGSRRTKPFGNREDPTQQAGSSSKLRRSARKRNLDNTQEAEQESNRVKAGRKSSKRRRTEASGSGTSGIPRENAMEQEDDAGENIARERESQNAPSRNVSGIQGLLRRLGAGLDELFPMSGSNSGRFRQILSVLRTSSDDAQRLDALTQLCDVLSVGSEESMVSFSVDSFVPPLVAILNSGSSPELMLLAARALTHMMDALPSSASSIAQNGAAAPLCSNLISIEFMDLAEQSLSALEKMSVDYPQSIVRAGGFAAALSYMDFFQTSVKRVAVSLASNLCRNPPSDSVTMIVDVLPLMMNILDSEDQRMRQSIIQGFARLAESFRSSSERLETFCGADFILIDKIISLVCSSPAVTLTPTSYSAALRLLSILAKGSAKLAAKELCSQLLLVTLRDIFDSGRALHAWDALYLTDALIPDATKPLVFEEYLPRRRRRHSSASSAAFQIVRATRRQELQNNPEPLGVFGRVLFGCLVRFCNASANASVRRTVLLTVSKFVDLTPAALLSELLISKEGTLESSESRAEPKENFASFVAGLLGENGSHQENLIGVCLVEASLKKLGDLKVPYFREGVMFELGRIGSENENSDRNKEDKSASKTKNDATDGNMSMTGQVRGSKRGTKDIKSVTSEKARSVLDAYTREDEQTNASRGILKELDEVEKALSGATSEEDLESSLKRFFLIFSKSGGVSNFELSQSKLVETLVSTFASKNLSAATKSLRAIAFTNAISDLPQQSDTISLLVSRVLGVLAAEEKLSIFVNENSTSSSTTMSSGLRQLTQPFKLRLRRASDSDGGEKLRPYSAHAVLIEPLATMDSIEDFLWPRVRPINSVGGSRCNTSGNNEEPTDEKDDEGNDDNVDPDVAHDAEDGIFTVGEGSAKDDDDNDEVEHVEENVSGSGSEDDMMDEDEDEEDAGDAASGFAPSDQLSRSLPLLDVDYELLERSPSRRPVPSPHVGFRSFGSVAGTPRSYAAAVTNEFRRSRGKSTDDDGMAEQRQRSRPKLVFKINDHEVLHSSSILQAVLTSTYEAGLVRPRMWEQVHTLTYSLRPSNMKEKDEEVKGEENATKGGTKGRPVRRSRRLRGSAPIEYSPNSEECSNKQNERHKSKSDLENRLPPTGKEDDTTHEPYVPTFSLASSIPERTAVLLKLLSYLHWIVENSALYDNGSLSRISVDPSMSFLSQKLTAKLTRQLSDPLALCGGAIPKWCAALARDVPFLLPFETRRILFHSTALGVARALHLLQARSDASSVNGSSSLTMGRSASAMRDGEARIGRIQRQKVRIHRDRLLDSAVRVLYMYGAHKTVLEVEYFDEVGTGLGPTLEFYTLVSRELQKTKEGLWRTQESASTMKTAEEKKLVIGKTKGKAKNKSKSVFQKYRYSSQAVRGKKRNAPKRILSTKIPVVRSPDISSDFEYVVPTGVGLYPSCIPSEPKSREKATERFQFIGRLVAKALSDGRLLELRFCSVFPKLLMAYARVLQELDDKGEQGAFDPDDVELLKHFPVESMGMTMLKKVDSRLAKSLQAIVDMVENGEDSTILNLCLSFTVPGHPEVELVPNGKDKEVTIENAQSYISKVVKYILFTGVKQQAAAFMTGFGEVLDAKSILLFQEDEFELLVCGPSFEKWDKEYLIRATRCDHGYRHESSAVDYLLRAMTELDQGDQGKFLQFVTGSPSLPVGGLIGLHPRLIIVKRTTEDGRSADECLPTVMTCTNYLKLPDYSSYEICKERLSYAIREGQGCFHLS